MNIINYCYIKYLLSSTKVKQQYCIVNNEKEMHEMYNQLFNDEHIANIKVYQVTEIFMEEQ